MDFIIAFISGAIAYQVAKRVKQKRTKVKPYSIKTKKETDELITVVLPTIGNDM